MRATKASWTLACCWACRLPTLCTWRYLVASPLGRHCHPPLSISGPRLWATSLIGSSLTQVCLLLSMMHLGVVWGIDGIQMPTNDHGTKAWWGVECQFMESVFSNYAQASVQRREKDSIEEAGTICWMKINVSEGFYLFMSYYVHVYYICIL